MNPSDLITHAERLLADLWRGPVQVTAAQRLTAQGRRNLVLRCRVQSKAADAPVSVVVKHACQADYRPDDPLSWPAVGLFRDWAGLEFLGGIGGQELCPKFYGGDRAAGFFIMEDVGAAEDLDQVLTRGSAARAEQALLQLARTLGHMHSASIGRAHEYQQIRDRLGPGDGRRRLALAEQVRTLGPQLVQWGRTLGFGPHEQLAQDLEAVARAMQDPGPFLAYTHADPCPDNCFLIDDRLCLIDFEFGLFRHALLDGVYGRLRFPTCKCVRDIPAPVIAAMETVYRRALAQNCPAAADDETFHRAVAEACAFWVLENLAHLLPRALVYEEPYGLATNRQRLLCRLTAFLEVSQRAGHLPGLHDYLERLLARLQRDWRATLPLFDAFHQSAELAPTEVHEFVQAVQAGDEARVRELLAADSGLARAKASDADQTPALFLAVDTKQTQVVRALLEHGADWRITTRSGWTVLARACSDSTPEIVDLLLASGADLNARDVWGSLPIYGAVANPAMLSHLLARGAAIDLKTAFDLSRLDLAAKLLREDPSRACFRFGTGISLLHDIVRAGENLPALEMLLTAGAEINARTNWGATPLHLAGLNGRVRSIEFLLSHGADANARDQHGQTPLDLARDKRHLDCARLLQVAER